MARLRLVDGLAYVLKSEFMATWSFFKHPLKFRKRLSAQKGLEVFVHT